MPFMQSYRERTRLLFENFMEMDCHYTHTVDKYLTSRSLIRGTYRGTYSSELCYLSKEDNPPKYRMYTESKPNMFYCEIYVTGFKHNDLEVKIVNRYIVVSATQECSGNMRKIVRRFEIPDWADDQNIKAYLLNDILIIREEEGKCVLGIHPLQPITSPTVNKAASEEQKKSEVFSQNASTSNMPENSSEEDGATHCNSKIPPLVETEVDDGDKKDETPLKAPSSVDSQACDDIKDEVSDDTASYSLCKMF